MVLGGYIRARKFKWILMMRVRASVWADFQRWRTGREHGRQTQNIRLSMYKDSWGWKLRISALGSRSGQLWGNPSPTHFNVHCHPIAPPYSIQRQSFPLLILKNSYISHISFMQCSKVGRVQFLSFPHMLLPLSGTHDTAGGSQFCGGLYSCTNLVQTENQNKEFRGWGRRNDSFLKLCMA